MVLGIIGGIGSGKSSAAQILTQSYGFQQIQTDQIARRLMEKDPELKRELIQVFGKEIYQEDGSLCKERYAGLIYQDPEKRKRSDSLVHPRVWEEVRRLTENDGKKSDIVIETALPDRNLQEICDHVICISASPETRVQRLMTGRKYTRRQAESVLANQKSEDWYREHADIRISNDGTPEELREEIRNKLCFLPV